MIRSGAVGALAPRLGPELGRRRGGQEAEQTSYSVAFVAWLFYKLVLGPHFSPLRDIPGPPSASLLYGNLERIILEEPGVPHREWQRKYGQGGVVRYRGFFGEDRLFFTDQAALNHILLSHAYEMPKPSEIMTPAFSPSALRDLTPSFFEMSYKLRDAWSDLIATDKIDEKAFSSPEKLRAYKEARTDGGQIVIEVMTWMSRITLDIIGLAGFGYEFNALDGQKNVLGDAFSGMMSSSVSTPSVSGLVIQRFLGQIITAFPFILNYVPNERIKAVRVGFATIDTESRKIVEQKKKDVAAAGLTGGGKDLITLLLKANGADAKDQMSDAELQGQMTTFLLAGHETTSTSLTWTLWKLACHPEVQTKLRAELRAARQKAKEQGREELGSDELSSLEYLDAVCVRPTEHCISVRAGQPLFISISAPNFNKAVFGEDADLFRPERWIEGKVGEKTQGVGVYSQILSFLAGPRACIGYKFSLLEMKAILSVLVDEFEFAEREPGLAFTRRSAIVTRPLVVGEEKSIGYAMPLRVKLAKRDE
ncbi:hypothetical protein RQP46_006427 [Phenoliferia psychrophenolica]